jgi:hypothetical protein
MFGRSHDHLLVRSRWAAIGAAVAVTMGAGGGIAWYASAADSSPSSFISIVPCRLFDTRPPTDNVGDRSTPLTTGETFARPVWGTHGACTIPSTATAISYNLTVPDPTVTGFIKLYPGDAAVPNASAINPAAGGGTKANSGIVGLSAAGGIALFNQVGPINALLDITGYFVAASPRAFSAWDTIPSGQTVTGSLGFSGTFGTSTNFRSVSLPAKSSVSLSSAKVNFSPGPFATLDDDSSCTGTAVAPTAPAGQVCLYIDSVTSVSGSPPTLIQGVQGDGLGQQGFYVQWDMAAPGSFLFIATWAFTAP